MELFSFWLIILKFISVPFISNFPEFNIRTYVSKNGISGVLFLTLDAESRITSMYAPWAYGLPYIFAKGKVEENQKVKSQKPSISPAARKMAAEAKIDLNKI